MTSICVYLGSSFGNHATFKEAAVLLGKEIATTNKTLIYGGSSLGLMGLLAHTVKEHGGIVKGIITEQLLDKEKPPKNLDELHIVQSMPERKLMMQQLSDSFLVMPGGLGTLEEAFETWNAINIGIFNKPMGFLNLLGFFDKLFDFIKISQSYDFIIKSPHQFTPKISSDLKTLLNALE